jgi:ElaA protein
LNFKNKNFGALSSQELYGLLRLRAEVFVVEQKCAYLDPDGVDVSSHHLWVTGHHDLTVAYARIIPPGVKYAEASIGRVVVARDQRGQGLAKELMQQAIELSRKLHPQSKGIRISAQSYLEKFYKSLGFVTVSEPYLEDDIPHIEMLLR